MSTVRTHRARLVEGRWLLIGAVLGATVSACFTALFFMFGGSGLIHWRVWLLLWPISTALMALANPGPWTETALVWAMVGASNIAVYVSVAALLSVLSYPVRRYM